MSGLDKHSLTSSAVVSTGDGEENKLNLEDGVSVSESSSEKSRLLFNLRREPV